MKENVQYYKMALALCGICVDEETAELLYELCSGIKKKKGSFSVKDAVQIQYAVKGKYEKVSVEAVPDNPPTP